MRPRTASARSAGIRPGADAVAARRRGLVNEAIEIARGLGAEPLTRRVAERMREAGDARPQGQRETTRANPAGLTARQLEVLRCWPRGSRTPRSPSGWSSRRGRPSTTWPRCCRSSGRRRAGMPPGAPRSWVSRRSEPDELTDRVAAMHDHFDDLDPGNGWKSRHLDVDRDRSRRW